VTAFSRDVVLICYKCQLFLYSLDTKTFAHLPKMLVAELAICPKC
jgi:hypothetical protein